MSEAFSAESEDLISGLNEPGCESSSSAKPMSGAGESSPSGGLESPATPTYEVWQFRTRENGACIEQVELPNLTRASIGGTGGAKIMLSTFCAEDSHAKTSASPADEPDSQAEEADSSMSSLDVQMSLYDPVGGGSLRTFPDSFPQTVEEISLSFSRRWPTSGSTTSRGECWTHATSEYPSGGGESSSLADVLEETVAERYFLSPRAAMGILRRAEKRGRELPGHLAAALETVAGRRTPNA